MATGVIKSLATIVFVFCCFKCVEAQESLLEEVLQIPRAEMELKDLLKLTAKETGLRYSYNTQIISPRTKIKLAVGANSVKTVLDRIKHSAQLDFIIHGNHIILFQKKKNTKQKIISARTSKEPNTIKMKPPLVQPASPADSVRVALSSKKYAAVNLVRDSFMVGSGASTVPSNLVLYKAQKPVAKYQINQEDAENKKQLFEAKKSSAKHNFLRFVIKPFVSVDETFYSGAGVVLGINALYASASLHTDYNILQIRYGAGSDFQISPSSAISFQFSSGQSQRSFDSLGNTFNTVTTKESLDRFGFAYGKKVSKHFSFSVIAQLNVLTRHYYLKDAAVPLKDIAGFHPGSRFEIIIPPYTLYNNFSDSEIPTKQMWMGLELRAYYNF